MKWYLMSAILLLVTALVLTVAVFGYIQYNLIQSNNAPAPDVVGSTTELPVSPSLTNP